MFENGVLLPLCPEEILGGVGVDAGEKAGAGGCANGIVAISMFKTDGRFRKARHVGRDRLRMSAIDGGEIVEVVADNEDDVRSLACEQPGASGVKNQ